MTRKFTPRQNCDEELERTSLFCRGRGYEAESSATPMERWRDSQQSDSAAAQGPPVSRKSGVLPSSTGGRVITATKLGPTSTSHSSLSSRLAQSISIQQMPVQRRSTASVKSSESTAINRALDPTTSRPVYICDKFRSRNTMLLAHTMLYDSLMFNGTFMQMLCRAMDVYETHCIGLGLTHNKAIN